MQPMTSRARVDAALAGEPVDRVPLGAWWPASDSVADAAALADAAVGAHRRYGWDWATIVPDWTLVYEAWGSVYDRPGGGPPRLERASVRFPDTLLRLRFLDPRKGALGEQVAAVRLARATLGDDVPLLITVPAPLRLLAELMADPPETLRYLQEHERHSATGLGIIMETLAVHAGLCIESGADGVMFDAGHPVAGEAAFRAHARPADLYVLSRVQEGSCNVLRVSGESAMLGAMLDYPVHAFGWHTGDAGALSLSGVIGRSGRAAMAGLSAAALASPADAAAEALAAVAATGGTRLLLAPGEALAAAPGDDAVRAIREALASAPGLLS